MPGITQVDAKTAGVVDRNVSFGVEEGEVILFLDDQRRPDVADHPRLAVLQDAAFALARRGWCLDARLLEEIVEGAESPAQARQQRGRDRAIAEQILVEDVPIEEGTGSRDQCNHGGGAWGIFE